MILKSAGSIYGAAATWRRRWYASHPDRQLRLSRPVVSIGNLRAGGAGKTPVVAALARYLFDERQRPAILTRGYARRVSSDAVTVVSDGKQVLADVDHAGDEPLMLARALPGVAVLVGADRYRSGRLAEEQLGVSIHVLDDGFQHMTLARDVDVLVVDEEDLADRVLPAGRLREPLTAAAQADALVTTVTDPKAIDRLRSTLQVSTVFRLTRTLGTPRWLTKSPEPLSRDQPVLAMAGIARPQRFFEDLKANGWRVADTLVFRDHHRFTSSDLRRVADAARAAGASAVVTTEKDAVRLEPLDPHDLPVLVVPLSVSLEPAFFTWLSERLKR